MTPTTGKLKFHDFFMTYFPHGAFVVAQLERAKLLDPCILEEKHKIEPITKKDLEDVRSLNELGYGVYFTPNAAKESLENGQIYSKANFESVNACYLDIDIAETKDAVFEEDFIKRENKKAEIAGHLMFAACQPSLVEETRNGFQVFWFTSCSLDEFKAIEAGLLAKYASLGADASKTLEMCLYRVPGFFHAKNGIVSTDFTNNKIKCEIRWELCNRNSEDGSFKYWPKDELLQAFPAPELKIWKPKNDLKSEQIQNDPLFNQAKNKSIIELVSNSGFSLKKNGKNFFICCPFHNEKTPSCSLFPEENRWYCFGCTKSGDTIDFVMKLKNINFSQAIIFLTSKS